MPPAPQPAKPPASPPAEKPKASDLIKTQDERLDALFKEPVKTAPTEPEKPLPATQQPEPPVEPVPEPEEETPVVEDQPPVTEEEEIDFDKLPAATPKERESFAQRTAKENGRALKELKQKYEEKELEISRLTEEVENYKRKNVDHLPVDEQSIRNHPDVSSLRDRIFRDLEGVARRQVLPEAGAILKNNFPNYLQQYMDSTSETDAGAARTMDLALRDQMKKDAQEAYRASTTEEEFDQGQADSFARDYTRDMLDLLVRNADVAANVRDKIEELKTRAREGTLAKGVEEYTRSEQEIQAGVLSIADLPDEAIEQNPHSMESVVASLVKKDEVWAGNLKKTAKMLTQVLLGPPALSQKDIDSLKSNGTDIKEFNKRRHANWLATRNRVVAQAAQGLLLRTMFEQNSKDAAAYKAMQDELDALNGGRSRKVTPETAPKPVVPARDRIGQSIEKYLT